MKALKYSHLLYKQFQFILFKVIQIYGNTYVQPVESRVLTDTHFLYYAVVLVKSIHLILCYTLSMNNNFAESGTKCLKTQWVYKVQKHSGSISDVYLTSTSICLAFNCYYNSQQGHQCTVSWKIGRLQKRKPTIWKLLLLFSSSRFPLLCFSR